jgi:hypothetical protein
MNFEKNIESIPNIIDWYTENNDLVVPEIFIDLKKYIVNLEEKKKILNYNEKKRIISKYYKRNQTELLGYEKNLLDNCIISNIAHLEYCDCMQFYYDYHFFEILNNVIKDIIFYKKDTKNKISMKLKTVEKMALKKTLIFCIENQVYCSDEFEKILQHIKMFSSKYPIEKDASALFIVNSVIDNLLSMIKYQKVINYEGIYYKNFDKYGNIHLKINPADESKRKYNESLVKSMEVLDKIFEGIKINVNTNAINIYDILSKDEKCNEKINNNSEEFVRLID